MDPSQFKDYYKTLGVNQSADQDDIKRVFRKLARESHPDVNKSPGSEARFKELSSAYDVLGDKQKRAEYDQLYQYMKNGGGSARSAHGSPGGGFNFGFGGANFSSDVEDLFSQFFGQRTQSPASHNNPFPGFGHYGQQPRRGSRPNRAKKPSPQTVEITLEEAFHGCSRQFDVTTPGSENKRIQVKIPAGVTDGQTIQLGAKANSNSPPMDHLALQVKILPHRLFTLDGKNIVLNLPVTPTEAALGATVTVPTLTGQVRLKVPANSQSGTKLSLRDKGLPGNPSGCQHVILAVVIGQPLTESQRELYRRLEQEIPFDPRQDLDY